MKFRIAICVSTILLISACKNVSTTLTFNDKVEITGPPIEIKNDVEYQSDTAVKGNRANGELGLMP